jgi:hypothetical protein
MQRPLTYRGLFRVRNAQNDAPTLRQAGIFFQRFLCFENRVAFAGVQRRGLPLPPILYFLEPGQVTQPRVVVFVELGFPDLFFHA